MHRSLTAVMGRVATALVPVVAGCAFAAAPAAAATPNPGPAGSGQLGDYSHNVRIVTTDCRGGPVGRRVLVVGDSITVRTRKVLVPRLVAAGWSVCLDARSGQPTSAALDNFSHARAFPDYADVIVMATGANDIFDPMRFPAQVARARTFATGRPLLWVTAWVVRSRVSADVARHDLINSQRVDAVVRKQVGRTRPGAVIDWYAFLAARASRPGRLLQDGVHTSDAGAVARTVLIEKALRAYRR